MQEYALTEKKTCEGEAVGFNDFEIIWVEICNYQKGSSIVNHSHEFFHFIYVDSGEGSITVDGTAYKMLTGKIFPIPPGVNHGFYNTSDEVLRTYELKFRLFGSEAKGRIEKLPVCMQIDSSPVDKSLLSLYREAHTDQLLSSDVTSLHFQLLMTYLLRCCENNKNETAKKKSVYPEIERVIDYVLNNLAEELPLEKLAEVAGFEKNYFLRKFKKQTGYTPIAFILNRRLEKAKELLRFSDMNITQIAEATGFKSVHYFSKVFFDNVHVRPSDYRMQ